MSEKKFHYGMTSYTGKPNGLIDEPGFTVRVGETFRIFEGSYGTATVLGIAPRDTHGDVYVRLARPYCYAAGSGTTAPTPLIGVEVFDITFARLAQHQRYEGSPMVV